MWHVASIASFNQDGRIRRKHILNWTIKWIWVYLGMLLLYNSTFLYFYRRQVVLIALTSGFSYHFLWCHKKVVVSREIFEYSLFDCSYALATSSISTNVCLQHGQGMCSICFLAAAEITSTMQDSWKMCGHPLVSTDRTIFSPCSNSSKHTAHALE